MAKNKVNIDPNPITDYEHEKIIPFIKNALVQRHVRGYVTEISGRKMLEALKKKGNIKLSDARLRKLIYEIRQQGFKPINGRTHVLIANYRGYRLCSDPKIVRENLYSLEDRVRTQNGTIEAVRRDLVKMEQETQSKLYEKQK